MERAGAGGTARPGGPRGAGPIHPKGATAGPTGLLSTIDARAGRVHPGGAVEPAPQRGYSASTSGSAAQRGAPPSLKFFVVMKESPSWKLTLNLPPPNRSAR